MNIHFPVFLGKSWFFQVERQSFPEKNFLPFAFTHPYFLLPVGAVTPLLVNLAEGVYFFLPEISEPWTECILSAPQGQVCPVEGVQFNSGRGYIGKAIWFTKITFSK